MRARSAWREVSCRTGAAAHDGAASYAEVWGVVLESIPATVFQHDNR